MAAKVSELAKLLKKIEKKCDKYNNDNWDCDCPFYDLDDYVAYIRKELKLKKNSDVYIFDTDIDNYMDEFYETCMKYVGKDVNIQVNETYTIICDGEVNLIVLVITKN